MGQLEGMSEEERNFMVVDKENGRVYDIRNEMHVQKLSTFTEESKEKPMPPKLSKTLKNRQKKDKWGAFW